MNKFVLLAAIAIAAPAVAAPTTKAPEFVKMAGASDLYEKTSSQLALKSATNPKVKAFAQMMISDHNKTTADVTAAAKSDGLTPKPPKMMPEQVKMISELKAAKGADMEKVYVRQQVTAHEQALALHTTYSQGGDKPALKQAATGAVPIVRTHLDQIKSIQSSMGTM
jgi:putative membrane protein